MKLRVKRKTRRIKFIKKCKVVRHKLSAMRTLKLKDIVKTLKIIDEKAGMFHVKHPCFVHLKIFD